MEEEVSQKTVNLAWQTTKLSVRGIYKYVKAYLEQLEKDKVKRKAAKNTPISYTKAEKKYVDSREGYSIVLPKDTDELRSYGKAFHNC